MPDQELEELKTLAAKARTLYPGDYDSVKQTRVKFLQASRLTHHILERVLARLERERNASNET